MMNRSHCVVYGAGISGLVAAIHLARVGHSVRVLEKRSTIGGPPQWHPSVHLQGLDLEKTSKYIDIDLAPCFAPTNFHRFHLFGHEKTLDNPENSYICLKGGRPGSIEHHLYGLACKAGVEFEFERALSMNAIRQAVNEERSVVVATGLEKPAYAELGIKYRVIQGYRAVADADEQPFAISCLGDYTGHEFAYVASTGRKRFALLFSRESVNRSNLTTFSRFLHDSEGLPFDDWAHSAGVIPCSTNLYKEGVVLAGTLSGMIDPFYLNGISGALLSGRIAAMCVDEREKALDEFRRFTRNFRLKQLFQKAFVTMPFCRAFSMPILYLNNQFKMVGVI